MRAKKIVVWISTSFIGFHRWKDAPDATSFLRDWHRHKFNVKVGVCVNHENRQIEFFDLKEKVDLYLRVHYEGQKFASSCEHIACELFDKFNAELVTVDEDGENGATVASLGGSNAPKQLPSAVVKKHCFIGTEAEGPNRGKRVLFVPGSTKPETLKILKADNDISNVERVYYGAGNDRSFNYETLRVIKKYMVHDDRIDIELDQVTPEIAALLVDSHFVIISLFPDDPYATYIKTFEDDKVVWTNAKTKRRYETNLADPLFSKDQDITI